MTEALELLDVGFFLFIRRLYLDCFFPAVCATKDPSLFETFFGTCMGSSSELTSAGGSMLVRGFGVVFFGGLGDLAW